MFLSSKTSIRGHLVIHEEDQHGNKIKVFDDHNIITLEGKDHIIRYLTNSIAGVAESVPPITAMVLSSNPEVETENNTWADTVAPAIVNSGMLHSKDEGDGKQVILESISATNSFIIKGRLDYNEGNLEPNNVIRSCCVVFGAGLGSGYHTTYVPSGKEKLLSRVSIGSLTKKEENAFVFTWSFFLT